MYNLVHQNTVEWLEFRKNKIGASEAPIIMEVAKKTPYTLWQQKLDLIPNDPDHPGMERGRRLEDPARLELEKITGLFFLPQVKIHPEYDWMMASCDAIDPEHKYVAEIKCPGAEDHGLAVAGKVPDKYFPQLQHQLAVCQLDMAFYFSFDGTQGTLLNVYRDEKYIKKMIEKEKEFLECIRDFVPPPLSDRDYIQKEDDEWASKAAEWRQMNSHMKFLEKREKQLKEELISMSKNHNSAGAGIKVSKVIRKGNVDYSLIPELQGVNLESYRKKRTEYWMISAS